LFPKTFCKGAVLPFLLFFHNPSHFRPLFLSRFLSSSRQFLGHTSKLKHTIVLSTCRKGPDCSPSPTEIYKGIMPTPESAIKRVSLMTFETAVTFNIQTVLRTGGEHGIENKNSFNTDNKWHLAQTHKSPTHSKDPAKVSFDFTAFDAVPESQCQLGYLGVITKKINCVDPCFLFNHPPCMLHSTWEA